MRSAGANRYIKRSAATAFFVRDTRWEGYADGVRNVTYRIFTYLNAVDARTLHVCRLPVPRPAFREIEAH